MHQGKILLHKLGKGPLKGAWFIPASFVDSKKGDKTAKDTAIRMVRKYLEDVDVEVVRELTAEGGLLEGLDTSEYSIKLGWFPAIAQLYEIKVKDKGKLKTSKDADFFKVSELEKLKGDIFPLMYKIVKYYFKNNSLAKKLYERGEAAIEKAMKKKDYYSELEKFDKKFRRR